MSTSCIIPVVIVPVLSNTTVSMRRVLCNTSTPLMTIPICAARPLPTINAVGVAKPSAQGHAIINTATAAVNASEVDEPTKNHPINVAIDNPITVGTKIPLTRSASLWTGAFVVCASLTRRVICAKVVSAPTRVARIISRPVRFIVVPVTTLPGLTSTGTLSPVNIETSRAEAPCSTTPSVGIISPGRTTITSPTRTRAASIVCSSPFLIIVAWRAPSASNDRKASPARRLARASKYLPANKNTVTATATSK